MDSESIILNKQKNLAETYKYKPLPPLISVQQRQEYLDALPEDLMLTEIKIVIFIQKAVH